MVGLAIGVYANVGVTDKFSVQPELLFSAQGSKYSESISNYSYEQKAKINYLSIPVMLQYTVIDNLYLQFGPQLGVLLSAKSEEKVTDGNISVSQTTDIKDSAESIDLGLNIGLGYKTEMGLNFDLRYNLGLTDIQKGEGEAKNQVFQFTVGYDIIKPK